MQQTVISNCPLKCDHARMSSRTGVSRQQLVLRGARFHDAFNSAAPRVMRREQSLSSPPPSLERSVHLSVTEVDVQPTFYSRAGPCLLLGSRLALMAPA